MTSEGSRGSSSDAPTAKQTRPYLAPFFPDPRMLTMDEEELRDAMGEDVYQECMSFIGLLKEGAVGEFASAIRHSIESRYGPIHPDKEVADKIDQKVRKHFENWNASSLQSIDTICITETESSTVASASSLKTSSVQTNAPEAPSAAKPLDSRSEKENVLMHRRIIMPVSIAQSIGLRPPKKFSFDGLGKTTAEKEGAALANHTVSSKENVAKRSVPTAATTTSNTPGLPQPALAFQPSSTDRNLSRAALPNTECKKLKSGSTRHKLRPF